eukprot:scaffold18310_cov31-Tisochrysis_lutea.AAC.3
MPDSAWAKAHDPAGRLTVSCNGVSAKAARDGGCDEDPRAEDRRGTHERGADCAQSAMTTNLLGFGFSATSLACHPMQPLTWLAPTSRGHLNRFSSSLFTRLSAHSRH